LLVINQKQNQGRLQDQSVFQNYFSFFNKEIKL